MQPETKPDTRMAKKKFSRVVAHGNYDSHDQKNPIDVIQNMGQEENKNSPYDKDSYKACFRYSVHQNKIEHMTPLCSYS